MRLNKWLARNARLSRRQADDLISKGSVLVNTKPAHIGQTIDENTDEIRLFGEPVNSGTDFTYLLFNKPLGYVCSHNGQGKPTIYDLLPKQYHHLKIAGRLDHDSTGLLLLTDNGDYILSMTHPRYGKIKTYEVILDHPITSADFRHINQGIELPDGLSKLHVEKMTKQTYYVTMSEGRNRQIRRTFAALGYKVTALHRTHLGPYSLDQLKGNQYVEISHLNDDQEA